MAHQLWTSPVTGYRRTGTRVKEIRALFESGVTVRSIYEPIKACPVDANATKIAEALHDHRFDIVGIKEPDTEVITRFVMADALKKGGVVRDHAQNVVIGDLISDATPLAKIFRLFGGRTYCFVLVDETVTGILTRADLNKPPARIYLFGLISLLEMHLVFWIRKEFGDAWTKCLSPSRLEAAIKLFDQRREQHQELNLCECLQICDKADVVVSRDTLRELFSIKSKTAGRKVFGRIQTLRDLLAHGQTNLTEGGTWEDVMDAVAWMEQALDRSDNEVEKLANEAGANYVDAFWSTSNG